MRPNFKAEIGMASVLLPFLHEREKEIKSQTSERGKREDTGHVRPFQEEDDEHDGQKVPRRRRRLGVAAAASARSRFLPQALLRRRRPAVAGRHEQLPLGSHYWIPPWLPRVMVAAASEGGEVEKSRRAAIE